MKNITKHLLLFVLLFYSVLCFGEHHNYVMRADAKFVTEMDEQLYQQKVADLPSSNNTEWHFKGSRPCIIDFYTTWCGPCRRLAPVMESLAEKYNGIIDFYKVDAEKQASLSFIFQVRSYPTLIFIPTAGIPQKAIGALPANEIESIISQVLIK